MIGLNGLTTKGENHSIIYILIASKIIGDLIYKYA